jgi:hypothetical protein
MRAIVSSILSAAATAGILLWASVPASAASDPYRWCAQYGRDGGRNCGFITLQQCLDTISGVGGGCERNTFYTGSDRTVVEPSRRKNKRSKRAR